MITNTSGIPGDLGVIENGAVALGEGRVAWVGPAGELPAELGDAETTRFDGMTALPGFVDAHTHAVFAGHRADEFGRRMAGASYQQILAEGGGIHSTVAATRSATDAELVDQTVARFRRMLATGTTCVEVKSGYGLDATHEARLLELAHRAAATAGIDLVPTFLAHVLPPGADRAGFVRRVIDEMLPVCAPHARFCDVFCDRGAFTVDEAKAILTAAAGHGLRLRLHAEQLAWTGAARLAAELGAISADHLDHVAAEDLAALRAAGTVAVLLPGVSWSLRSPQPPARMIWEAGVPMAIATDCNPGSSFLTTMPLVIALAVLEMGLTPDQAVWAATRGGALAVADPERGRLVPGAIADLVILAADSHHHLAYRPDSELVAAVIKDGRVLAPGR